MEKARTVDWMKNKNIGHVAGALCRSCGAKTGSAKFCPECGTPTSQKKSCMGCGHDVEGSPKFCPKCGYKFA